MSRVDHVRERKLLGPIASEMGLSNFGVHAAQAVEMLESHYGQDYPGSHNRGSVHAGPGEPAFEHEDRNAQGKLIISRFKIYPDDETAIRDFLRILTRTRSVRAILSGPPTSALSLATAMRKAIYHVTPPEIYAERLIGPGKEIARALKEPTFVPVEENTMDTEAIRAALQRTATDFDNFDNEVARINIDAILGKGPPLPFRRSAWKHFYSQFTEFYAANVGSFFLSDDVYNETIRWQNKLKEWRDQIPADMIEAPMSEPSKPIEESPIGAGLGAALGSTVGTVILGVGGFLLIQTMLKK